MRHWKIGGWAVVAALAASAAAASVIRHNGGSMGGAARARDGATCIRNAGAGGVGRQEDRAGLSRIYGADRSDPQHLAAGQEYPAMFTSSDAPDGADVKEGDLLYTIDPRDYQAALDQAKAQMQRDKAALEYAQLQSQPRRRPGRATASSPRTIYDQRISALGTGGSGARRWTRRRSAPPSSIWPIREIRAPFAGRLGRNQASVGTLVSRRRLGAQHAGAARSASTSPSIRARPTSLRSQQAQGGRQGDGRRLGRRQRPASIAPAS